MKLTRETKSLTIFSLDMQPSGLTLINEYPEAPANFRSCRDRYLISCQPMEKKNKKKTPDHLPLKQLKLSHPYSH